MFGGTFAPRGWALCDGQLLNIADNSALFSILGTTYGGDGRTTFGLPDLRGRFAMHAGTGPGLPQYRLGAKGGVESISQPPAHTHGLAPNAVNNAGGDETNPAGNALAVTADEDYSSGSANAHLGGAATASTGTPGPVSVRNPFQAVNFIIALTGVFPSRS
jgi:microcystin-dependent protein